MFTLRINREKYAAQSVTGVVVDGETYGLVGEKRWQGVGNQSKR